MPVSIKETTINFSNQNWPSTQPIKFDFEVTDSTAWYNMFLVFRHQDAYNYQNVWLNLDVKTPDSSFTIKRNFTLSDNKKWFGVAMDDIIEHRIPFSPTATQFKKGKYSFTLTQIMREDPLLHVFRAGLRLEKTK